MRLHHRRPRPDRREPGKKTLRAALGLLAISAASAIGAPAAHADASTDLALSGFSSMTVDQSAGHVFVSQGADGSGIVATDLQAADPQLIAGTAGATSMAVSPDGGTLYAVVPDSGLILAIDARTLEVTAQYSPGSGLTVTSLAVAGGSVWFGWTSATDRGLGSLAPDGAVRSSVWHTSGAATQVLAGTPVPGNELAVASSFDTLYTFQVIDGALQWQGALQYTVGSPDSHLLLTPDGKDVAESGAGGFPGWFATAPAVSDPGAVDPPTLAVAPVRPYSRTDPLDFRHAVIAPDGSLATSEGADLIVENTSGTQIGYRFPLPDGDRVPVGGLAWAPDSSALYAVAQDTGGGYHLFAQTQPEIGRAALGGVFLSSSMYAGQPYTFQLEAWSVSASVSNSLPNAAVTLTLYDAEHPGGLPLQPTTAHFGGTRGWTVAGTYPVHGTGVSIQVQLTDPQDGVVPINQTFTPERPIVPDTAATGAFQETGTTDHDGNFVRGKAITFTGDSYVWRSGAPLTGVGKVDVVRVDAQHPAGIAVGTVTTDAKGHFTFTDTPQVGGLVHYRFAYDTAGTDLNLTRQQFEEPVLVDRATTPLSVAVDKSSYAYDGTIKATAHLGTTYNGRTVTLEERPAGGAVKVLRTGTVDAKGNVSTSFTSPVSATVYAVFPGDYRYAPRTVSVIARVQARVGEQESADHGSVRIGTTTYRIYRPGTKPSLTATVAPGKAGECGITFQLQHWYQGAWRTISTSACVKANASSTATHAFAGLTKGGQYRVRAVWNVITADTRNVTTYGAWVDLTVRS
ncbi:hypothetical protein GA0115240_154726 [Streptomyces sp. DvalAA-14]|uniref:hypothetical protein n=1 Tax=unclassified Streptomyces TaxID=2593676 RepID=UPI00081BBD43|nr:MULTISPECIES: hypothetical protein [unclassified Streptomyces]MYS23635.1 hypothetical protein [Streptomyces sp. SID4948]SCE36487.1 hypothetical protein GA0115240_154726 [Streptomyces sp. DvalAA-14]